jgi:hypothetical protein
MPVAVGLVMGTLQILKITLVVLAVVVLVGQDIHQ